MMLRNRLGLVVLLCLLVLMAAACASGEPAPDFEMTLFGTDTREAGETLRMSELEGRPVVLNFWFPSCPPCVAEMPEFERVYQNHKEDGVEFVGVQLLGIDTAEDGQNFADALGVSYALGADEDGIVAKYRVPGFPMTVFVDRDQNIVRRWQGVLNEEKLEELVGEILN